MSTRIVIDWTRCDAHGLCAELLPEAVTLDDWGYPILTDGGRIEDTLHEHARLAVRACPQLALLLKK
jgi:ferredoxin